MSNYIQWLKNAAVSRQVRRLVVCAVLALPGVTILSGTCRVAIADDDGIPDLAHPLIAESPTPDTELRFEYIVINSDSADELEINPEGELAIMPGVSIEVDIPYKVRDPSDGSSSENNLDVTEIALKLARGLDSNSLIGGGLELGLPTGDDRKDIGSNNELVVKPFLDAGVISGSYEYVGFLGFEFPINQDAATESEKDLGLEYNLAFAYWFAQRTRGILELDGEMVAVGDDNEAILNVSWGFIGAPIRGVPLEIGLGISLPVTRDRGFDQRSVFSLLYQF